MQLFHRSLRSVGRNKSVPTDTRSLFHHDFSKSRGLLLFFVFFLIALTAEAVDGIVLYPRTTGWFQSNYKFMVSGGASRPVKLPIPFYLIRHPQGVVLFDSGLGEEFREQVHGWWIHQFFNLLLPTDFKGSDAAVMQLKAMGIPPEAVRFIICSHLHYDHAGGLRDFPNATILVSRAEWENANVGKWQARLRGIMSEQLVGIEKRLWVIDYQPGTRFGPFDASFDPFGDGSIILLSTPGHTPGHQSLLVTLGSGQKVLLTGDAVWVRENFLAPAPKGWVIRFLEEKRDLAWETTLKIRKFHDENPAVFIIPGHDPSLWQKMPKKFD